MDNSIKQIDIELAATDTKHLQNILTTQQQQITNLTATIEKLQSALYSVMMELKDVNDSPEQNIPTEWLSWKRSTD